MWPNGGWRTRAGLPGCYRMMAGAPRATSLSLLSFFLFDAQFPPAQMGSKITTVTCDCLCGRAPCPPWPLGLLVWLRGSFTLLCLLSWACRNVTAG